MKKLIKDTVAQLVYLLYDQGIFKNNVKVCSIDETLERLLDPSKSLVRFGDGEIVMIKGENLKLQQASPEISEGLKRILTYEHADLMVSVQGVFDGVELYHKNSRQFWKDHLLFCRKIYEKFCNKDRVYCDTAVTRCYYAFEDKSKCAQWFSKFGLVWKQKDIVVVEGVKSHNGVGNDLFDNANSVERIICPPSDAYKARGRILEECRKYPKDRLFLLSVGVTAKFLAEDLFLAGYRVIDIGNLDMEYEWFLRDTRKKIKLDKHDMISRADNIKAGYTDYLDQIKVTVEA